MKKSKLILTLILLLTTGSAMAQKLILDTPIVDVGKTGYEHPVTAVFEFRTKNGRKLRITEVRPDCNCTVVDYPKGELGDKFQVRMTYDARQLGHFDKQAAIITNNGGKPIYIRMKGVVLTEVLDFSGTYPIEMGDLRLDKNELEFDDINKGTMLVQELHIVNNGSKACQPNLMHLPSYLQATTTPEKLAPGRAGKITVTLNSAKLRDYGLTQTSVYVAANPGDKVRSDHEITVSAVLLPAFEGMTEAQKEQAPRIQLSKETIDITFDGKSKKADIIDITNGGRSELNISSLQMFTSGLRISLDKRRLRPGESARLKVTALRDDLKKVRTKPRILMITNDPQKPKIVININAK